MMQSLLHVFLSFKFSLVLLFDNSNFHTILITFALAFWPTIILIKYSRVPLRQSGMCWFWLSIQLKHQLCYEYMQFNYFLFCWHVCSNGTQHPIDGVRRHNRSPNGMARSLLRVLCLPRTTAPKPQMADELYDEVAWYGFWVPLHWCTIVINHPDNFCGGRGGHDSVPTA